MKSKCLYSGLFRNTIMNQTNDVSTKGFFESVFYSTIRNATASSIHSPLKNKSCLGSVFVVGLEEDVLCSNSITHHEFSASSKQPTSFFDELGIHDITPTRKGR